MTMGHVSRENALVIRHGLEGTVASSTVHWWSALTMETVLKVLGHSYTQRASQQEEYCRRVWREMF